MSEKPLASKRIQAIREAAREAMTRRGPRDVDPIWLEHALKYYGYTIVSREASEEMIEAGSAAIQNDGFVDAATRKGWSAMIARAEEE